MADNGSPSSDSPARPRLGRWWAAALALLAVGAAINVAYLLTPAGLDLAGDEAHYWEWSRRLDLSYYSKGPLVAYIIAAGRAVLGDVSRHWLGHEELAVRGPAILLSVFTGLGVFVLGRQTWRSPGVALGAMVLLATVPIVAAGSTLMTIDAPLACAWTWALVTIVHALRTERLAWWLVVGVLIAVGVLAKYTMVLLFPAVGLAILIEPTLRRWARRPGPYLATLIGLTGLVPILVWNASHDWVSFRHVAGQAGVAGGPSVNPAGPVEYLLGQLAVANAFWLVGMGIAARQLWRSAAGERPAIRLLILAMVTPFAVFLVFSPITKVQPNWPVLGLLPGVVLLAGWLHAQLRSAEPRAQRWTRGLLIAGVVWGLGLALLARHSAWLTPVYAQLAKNAPPWNPTPVAQYDPTARLKGWSTLGEAVGEMLAAVPAGEEVPFIVTDDYQVASEIAFYCPGEPTVYCIQSALGDRLSQYDLWPGPLNEPASFIGRPCLLVGTVPDNDTPISRAARAALPNLELLRTVEYTQGGHLLRVWPIYRCPAFAGFPTGSAPAATKY